MQPKLRAEMNSADSDFAASLIGLMAVGRYRTVDEIVGFASYLAGSEAAYITGASLLIDGCFAA